MQKRCRGKAIRQSSGPADGRNRGRRRQRRDRGQKEFDQESFLEVHFDDAECEWEGPVERKHRQAAVNARRAIERYQEDKALKTLLYDILDKEPQDGGDAAQGGF